MPNWDQQLKNSLDPGRLTGSILKNLEFFLGPLTLGCQTFHSLGTCVREGPGEAPKMDVGVDWCRSRFFLSSTGSLHGAEKAHKIATKFLKAIPRVFPTHTDWSIIPTCRLKKNEYVTDFKALLDAVDALFAWHSGFRAINGITQPALVALFVNG